MSALNKIIRGDKVIWIVALLLAIISVIVVYSATSARYYGQTGKVLMKHAAMLLFGFVMMFGASKINYKRYAKVALLLMIPCLALLLYTLLFGRDINDANRSISLGGISFQPSEMAKIILITYLARQIVMMGDNLQDFKEVIVKLALPILVTAALIFPENLSTAAILVAVCMVLLFVARVKFLHIMAIVGLCVAGMGLYLLFDAAKTEIGNKRAEKASIEAAAKGEAAMPYVPKKNRIKTWSNRLHAMGESKEEINPFDDKHMQSTFAKIAVATSSFFGKGPGKSEQRNFLPHPYSDFIYAIIIEEYGLVGGLIVLMLYIILFTRVLRICIKRPLSFGALMAFGLGFLVIVQAMVNMGVSIGLLPVTGQPLPFVSMGGSSIMATGLIIGMILSVTRSIEDETALAPVEGKTENENIEEEISEADESESENSD
ncbi:MAG: FtsW/RodA/SpoVE family cell cycle protein [Bacteroidales bacterium]|nr:FtsW/RodA/SpoVE family cell cycle protein [Bacteroidales bacterium]